MNRKADADGRGGMFTEAISLGNSIGSDSGCDDSPLNPILDDARTDSLYRFSPAALSRLADRLLANVAPPNEHGCRLWTGSIQRKRGGYGQMAARVDGQFYNIKPHRLAYFLAHGHIESESVLMHRCDTPLCLNPDHLTPGTHAENLQDAIQKGRLVLSRPRVRKLALADRLAIYWSDATGAELARRYGVSETCIGLTRQGRFVGCPGLVRVASCQLTVLGEVA